MPLPPRARPTWLAATEAWLRASQVGDDRFVAFAEVSQLLLQGDPDLYSSSWLAQLSAQLGLPQPPGLVPWLQSLRGEDGAYRDPLGRFPPVVSTLFALAGIDAAHGEVRGRDATASFVAGMKQPDGLYGILPKTEADAQRWSVSDALATNRNALEVFHLLGVDPPDVGATREALLARMAGAELPAASAGTGTGQEVGLLLDGLRLLGVEPAAVPQRSAAQAWVSERIRGLAEAEGEVSVETVSDAERAVVLAGYLGVDPPGLSALLERVAAAQLWDGGFGTDPHSVPLDPQVTFRVAHLFALGGRAYPRQAELEATIGRYRVEKGWRTVFQVTPKLQATLYGVGIATALDLDLPRQPLINYLMYEKGKLTAADDPATTVQKLYFVARTLQLLGVPLEGVEGLREDVEQAVERLEISTDAINAETLARATAAMALTGTVPSAAVAARICDFVASLQNADGGFGIPHQTSDVNTTYQASVVLSTVGPCQLPHGEPVRWLQSMQMPEGGFLTAERIPMVNMDATYFASMALALHGAEPLDRPGALGYVERSVFEPFGFSFVAADSPLAGEMSGVATNLKITYEALFLLGRLEGGAPSMMWELPP